MLRTADSSTKIDEVHKMFEEPDYFIRNPEKIVKKFNAQANTSDTVDQSTTE